MFNRYKVTRGAWWSHVTLCQSYQCWATTWDFEKPSCMCCFTSTRTYARTLPSTGEHTCRGEKKGFVQTLEFYKKRPTGGQLTSSKRVCRLTLPPAPGIRLKAASIWTAETHRGATGSENSPDGAARSTVDRVWGPQTSNSPAAFLAWARQRASPPQPETLVFPGSAEPSPRRGPAGPARRNLAAAPSPAGSHLLRASCWSRRLAPEALRTRRTQKPP